MPATLGAVATEKPSPGPDQRDDDERPPSGGPGPAGEADGEPSGASAVSGEEGLRRARYRDIPKAKVLWLLLKDTATSCSQHRVIGLAAESAFFTLLSLPPLLLGLVGLLSSLDAVAGTNTLEWVRLQILDASSLLLSERGVEDVVRPLIDDLVQGARPDIMSIGFIVALWSGSRAVNVFVGTITVMYGLDGHRNPAATRLLAFTMYVISLVVGAIVVPALAIGPDLMFTWVPQLEPVMRPLYWPVVVALCVGFLTTLYHVAVPVRSPWREDLPGALVALGIWAACAWGMRVYLRTTVEGQSIYGSLAVPVAILLWLGLSAFAVLVGAALNAALDRVWPAATTAAARAETDRAREAALLAVRKAIRERRTRADKEGVEESDSNRFARLLAESLSPAELRRQIKRLRSGGNGTERGDDRDAGTDHEETDHGGGDGGTGDG
ncbi:hypothetical protein FNQ90_18030, partial [Streptomyces alkaliphilus]